MAPGLSIPVLLAYLGLSLAAFMAYAFDKSASIAKRWRTAEQTLHLFGLAGGWPGALLAQQVLLHKTSEPGFVGVFWITVALNIAAFLGPHAGLLPLPGSVTPANAPHRNGSHSSTTRSSLVALA